MSLGEEKATGVPPDEQRWQSGARTRRFCTSGPGCSLTRR